MADPVQEQLIALRRQQILDAAAKVFADKGFHAATIKDIAKTAGIADGTIYNYFKSKTALLFAIFDVMAETIRNDEEFARPRKVDIDAAMKAYLRHPLMALKEDNFELFRVVVSELLVNQELRTLYYDRVLVPTLAMAETQLQMWVEQRLIKPVNPELTVRIVSGVVLGLILEHIVGDPLLERHWDELPDLLTDLLLYGLAGEKP